MSKLSSPRDAYGKTLVRLGHENKDIVVLDGDLSKSTKTCLFGNDKDLCERFFDCGIAEQNMMGIAAGLAASGKTVFASSFAVFAVGRCFDQLRMSIAHAELNVKIVATHAGISVGEDGVSHQAMEDLALACSLPGFTVIVPSDAIETTYAVETAASTKGPFYIRLGRSEIPEICNNGYRFNLGKAATFREGSDVTIIAMGIMVAKALEAAESLQQIGIDARILNMATIKPMDEAAIIRAASETGAIVTAEEHFVHGGLFSKVAQIVAQNCPVPMGSVAVNDTYARSGKPGELLEKYGLTADVIKEKALAVVERKSNL